MLQMGKHRHRGAKKLAQGHTGNRAVGLEPRLGWWALSKDSFLLSTQCPLFVAIPKKKSPGVHEQRREHGKAGPYHRHIRERVGAVLGSLTGSFQV